VEARPGWHPRVGATIVITTSASHNPPVEDGLALTADTPAVGRIHRGSRRMIVDNSQACSIYQVDALQREIPQVLA
jgi:hypothetical protein